MGQPKSGSPIGKDAKAKVEEEEAAVELQMSPVTPRESDTDPAAAVIAGKPSFLRASLRHLMHRSVELCCKKRTSLWG